MTDDEPEAQSREVIPAGKGEIPAAKAPERKDRRPGVR